MANPFVHLELNTTDLKKAQAFYGGMFGWQFQDNDMGPMGIYSTFKPDKEPAAECIRRRICRGDGWRTWESMTSRQRRRRRSRWARRSFSIRRRFLTSDG